MLRFRTFHNADPPVLVEIWQSRARLGSLMQALSADVLERLIFAKPYFDPAGLILALDEDQPVGFAHAAFGPNQALDGISTETGVTCVVVVRPDCHEAEVAAGLLGESETYLRARGARVLYGGMARPLAPFYFGIYGGSEPVGVPQSDTVSLELYRSHGYVEADRRCLFRGQLISFQLAPDRRQMQWRRKMLVEEQADPPPRSWWEACITADLELSRFALAPQGGGPPAATATFRSMKSPTGEAEGVAAGLIDLEVLPTRRRQGLGKFLLCESFRQLARQEIACVEAQASRGNTACLALLQQMRLKPVDEGIVFRKEVG